MRFTNQAFGCVAVWLCGGALLATAAEPAATTVNPPSAVGPVLKLFQSGRLPPERQPPVVEMICKRGNAADLRVIFDRIISPDGFTSELRISALQWLTDAAVTRKVIPAGDLGALAQLIRGNPADPQAPIDPALQRHAIRLGSVWKVASIAPSLQELALTSETPAPLRQAAIAGLIEIADPGSQATLKKLAQPGQAIDTRIQAVAGLATLNLNEAAALVAPVLKAATPRTQVGPLLDAFFQQKGGADILAAALKENPPSADIGKIALRYMYSVGRSDSALSNVLGEAAGIAADPPPPTPEEVAAIVSDVISKGNAERGEEIFRRQDLSCLKCHAISRAGGQVGPDLSAVGGSSPTDYIVNSILNPNLAVKEQYVTRVFQLDSGKVITGVVIDRDDVRVNLRDVNGQTIVVPTADIEEEIEGQSLMPRGLTKFLTREELIDLARFVSELGKAGPYGINQRQTIQRWKQLQSPAAALTESVPHLEHVRQYLLGTDPAGWTSVYSKVGGVLPLSELRVDGKPTVVILQGMVDVRTAGNVAFDIRSTEKFQGWIDAEFTDNQTHFQLPLTAGRHLVSLRVEISDRVQPTLEVELSSPADSSAKFEIVAGN